MTAGAGPGAADRDRDHDHDTISGDLGAHDLIVSLDGCELWGRCSCGTQFGGLIRPDQSVDVFALRWETHVMLLPARTAGQPCGQPCGPAAPDAVTERKQRSL